MLANACRKAGVKHFCAKGLCHSFNQDLARRGVPSRVRVDLLGHSTTQMTDNVYTHAEESDLVEAKQKLVACPRNGN